MRRLMSLRMATEVGAWLSATESPEHSGHLNSVSRSCARAARDCEPLGHSTTASAITTTRPSAIHGPQRLIMRAASRRLPRRLEEQVELAGSHRAVLRRGHDAAGRDGVGLGLAPGAEVERSHRSRIERDGPPDPALLHVGLHVTGLVLT